MGERNIDQLPPMRADQLRGDPLTSWATRARATHTLFYLPIREVHTVSWSLLMDPLNQRYPAKNVPGKSFTISFLNTFQLFSFFESGLWLHVSVLWPSKISSYWPGHFLTTSLCPPISWKCPFVPPAPWLFDWVLNKSFSNILPVKLDSGFQVRPEAFLWQCFL